MTIAEKLDKLRIERGWTIYKMSAESGVNDRAIRNWFNKGNEPSLSALNLICQAFNITLGELFADDDNQPVEMTPEVKEFVEKYKLLDKVQKQAVNTVIDSYRIEQ